MIPTLRRLPASGFALLAPLPSPRVFAATLTVNSTADNLIAGDGQCTLREAIINANSDSDTTAGDCMEGSRVDTIEVPAGRYRLSIPGSDEDDSHTGDLDGELTLRGAGASASVIDAAGIERVMSLFAKSSIQDLGITGGHAGGLLLRADAQLARVEIFGSTGGIAGGVTATVAGATIRDSSITGNETEQGGTK